MKNKLIIMLAVTLLSACANKPEHVTPFEEDISVAEYQIGNADQLYISVWQNPELSLAVSVRPDGQISMPLIGDIQAKDLAPEALSKNIAKKLNKYIRSPNVTVIVTAANSAIYTNRIRITGAVNNPLSIPFYKDITVLDLVLEAGGLTEFANADDAILYRKTPSGIESYPVYIHEILDNGSLETNYELRPSDILIIPESVF
ncbi:sugar ABC transporter substrate-binding protein [Psychromonas sp. psych-6C06]|uniref:XrtA/PEP-CTERM system exopolysaccharide export protein n=1 Tax=Psychromonas sp. psych-6C06 TaxID=2058089 RepID=UPI000C326153|nr:XrtA/PEP-CTERM system exopolysaccharide export protein [Psychromonas sp. psych-6C06]PKF61427.1 sugar ABC transporter substrate-binding protein [Psychromonas sp. psych-6C06]